MQDGVGEEFGRGCPAQRIDVLVVDFDRTLIRENLLIQWVLHLLCASSLGFKNKLRLLLQSMGRGLASMLLCRHAGWSERAVRIAYGAFRNVSADSIHELVAQKSRWRKGYALNLNAELLDVLRKLAASAPGQKASTPKVIVTSQGSCVLAIEAFLRREDVAEQLVRAGIAIDLSDAGSLVANRLEVANGRFTGQLTPPVITKHHRWKSFPENAVFIGDGTDEAVLGPAAGRQVRFLNYRKAFLGGR